MSKFDLLDERIRFAGQVLSSAARLLSVLCSLWETLGGREDRAAAAQHYAEETFVACVLEAVRICRDLSTFENPICGRWTRRWARTGQRSTW
jgi:hypothetical protein